jgi:hypothetical protein
VCHQGSPHNPVRLGHIADFPTYAELGFRHDVRFLLLADIAHLILSSHNSSVEAQAHADGSERTRHGAERDDGGKRHKGADDADHNNVAIALSVRRSTDREQRDHRAIMRQAIECA